jgi:hypothetical protein
LIDLKHLITPLVSSNFWPSPQYNGQKIEDNKGVIRSCKSKDRQYNGQKFEDPKGVARSFIKILTIFMNISYNIL